MGNETVSQVQFTQPTNVTTTVGASAELDTPVGLAFDKSGNLYIASFDGNAIVEVTAAGTIVEQFAKINSPNAPIVYNGELYVCDKYDNQIMEVNLASQQVQTYVNNTFGLSNPIDMAIDPAGNLYVCSQNNNTIYEVTPGGNNATAITANNNNNLLDSPVSMVMGPDGNLYVYNSGNSAVIEVALPSGKQSVYANLSGSVAGTFAGLVFGPDGYLYVANNGNSTMSQLAPGSLVEGQGITNQTVLHFTDGNPSDTASDYSATVHLGDGNTVTLSSSGAVTGPPGAGLQIVNDPAGGFDVQLTYPYPEFLSNATFSVTVNANDGATLGALTANFSVLDAPLQGSSSATAGGFANVLNSSALSNATFTDANPGDHQSDFTATINWGDNSTPSNGQVVYQGTSDGSSTYMVTGSHEYTAQGSYQISIAVTDAGGKTATIMGNATVAAYAAPDGSHADAAARHGRAEHQPVRRPQRRAQIPHRPNLLQRLLLRPQHGQRDGLPGAVYPANQRHDHRRCLRRTGHPRRPGLRQIGQPLHRQLRWQRDRRGDGGGHDRRAVRQDQQPQRSHRVQRRALCLRQVRQPDHGGEPRQPAGPDLRQ